MNDIKFSQRDVLLIDILLKSIKKGRRTHSTLVEVLHRGNSATLEECGTVEGLLFSLSLVSGDLSCFFLTEKGMRARKIGFAAYTQENLQREHRRERRESIAYVIEWVTVVCALLTVVLSLIK